MLSKALSSKTLNLQIANRNFNLCLQEINTIFFGEDIIKVRFTQRVKRCSTLLKTHLNQEKGLAAASESFSLS